MGALIGGEVVGQVVALEVSAIEMGERLRPVDAGWAEALAGIMARDGQMTPIEVARQDNGFVLVTGGHRLTAAKLLGWDEINAIIVSADDADRRLREVSENLWRRGLDPVDRAAFVAELVDLARARDGASGKSAQQVAAEARWQKALKADAKHASATIADAYGWTGGVADLIGVSLRTVENDLLLHRRLTPAAVAALRGHPVMQNATQLRALAKLGGGSQIAIADMLVDGAVRSVGEAIDALEGKQRLALTPEEKRLSAVLGAFGRIPLPTTHRVVSHWVVRGSGMEQTCVYK